MSEFDPFDNVPADVEVEDTPVEQPKKAPVKKAPPKAAGDEGKIVLTFKEGAGFDSSWTVVHANNVEDANAILSDPGFKELLDRSKKVAGYYRGGDSGGGNDRRGSGPSAAPAGAQQPPSSAPAAPGPDWQYKTGLKKDGSGTWQAWMPPRGSNEKPVWF